MAPKYEELLARRDALREQASTVRAQAASLALAAVDAEEALAEVDGTVTKEEARLIEYHRRQAEILKGGQPPEPAMSPASNNPTVVDNTPVVTRSRRQRLAEWLRTH